MEQLDIVHLGRPINVPAISLVRQQVLNQVSVMPNVDRMVRGRTVDAIGFGWGLQSVRFGW